MEGWASPIALAVIDRMLGLDASPANLTLLRRQATALNIEAFPVGGTGERDTPAQPATERILSLLRRAAKVLPRALLLMALIGPRGTVELARYVGSKNVPPDTPRQYVSHGDAVEREALIIDLLVQFARVLGGGTDAAPDGAVFGRFAAAQREGRISAVESMMACLIILLAGYGTTSSLLACAIHRFATTPGLLRELAHDTELVGGFVEELLRYYGPLQRTARRTTRHVNLGGVELPKNAQLIVALGAANVDPARFEQPALFDPKRPNANQHIAFGRGIHVCLGAALARVEARIALSEFVRQVRHVELDPKQVPSYIVSRDTGMYGFESLFIRVSGHSFGE
jgi:cytochrome P450